MRVKYVGDVVPHLTNQWVEVPDDLHLYQATSWIEVNLAHPQNDETDEAQSAQLEEEEGDGFEPVDRVSELEFQLAELNNRLEQPDVSRAADAVSSTARAIQSSFTVASELKAIEERAHAQASINKTLSAEAQAFSESAAAERKKTLDLIKGNQNLVNHALNSHSKQLNGLKRSLNEAEQEVRFLREQAQKDKGVIAKAGNIIRAWEARE